MKNMLGNGTSQKEVSELLKSVIERVLGDDGARWMDIYKRVHRNENPFEKDSDLKPRPYHREVKSWEKFYKKVFNETFDFSQVCIPQCPGIPGKEWWIIILAQGMKPQKLFNKCKDHFGAYTTISGDLDEVVTSDRMADEGHYAIWVRANVEADPQFKNLSANKLAEMKHNGITLEERLVLELFYFWKTKKHLDINSWTLCAGSRYSGGDVPCVDWDDGGLYMLWYGPDAAADGLRSREAVSSAIGG